MKKLFLFLLLSSLLPTLAMAGELTGFIGVEGRLFLNPPAHEAQRRDNGSLSLAPEYYHEFDADSSFTFAPFLRIDGSDEERTHFDIRELFFLKVYENFELSVGLRKVFWGVTESQHLVDIINQNDGVESPDGEDKLGQPMIATSFSRDWGTVDLYLMPWFRERTFPGKKGRFRTEPVVDSDNAIYEKSAEERHIDFAARYGHYIKELEFALSHFSGTSREPSFILDLKDGRAVLIPYYEIIDQTGLEAQYITGEWLWKFEGIRRSGSNSTSGGSYYAATAGYEYTFTGVRGTYMDLGLLTEWLYDDRGASASSPFENDLMVGGRLTVNDISDTQILAGMIVDIDENEQIFFLESSRRIGEKIKVTLEAGFYDLPDNSRLSAIRDDDYIQLGIDWYF